MASREALNAYSEAQRNIVALAKADLNTFWALLDLSNPALVRDQLLDFVPALVQTYGDVAASAAAEWYEGLRAKFVPGAFSAVTGGVVDADQVAGSVRYAAGGLFTDTPEQVLASLNGSVQRLVQYSGRETVARNVASDRSRPRYARIPQGVTCAWCTMLASRGFVYHSKKSAGETDGHFHDDCDCQLVPSWDKTPFVEGYDPDRMYDQYQAAREASGSGNQKDIAASMRRLFPDELKDGVQPVL